MDFKNEVKDRKFHEKNCIWLDIAKEVCASMGKASKAFEVFAQSAFVVFRSVGYDKSRMT